MAQRFTPEVRAHAPIEAADIRRRKIATVVHVQVEIDLAWQHAQLDTRGVEQAGPAARAPGGEYIENTEKFEHAGRWR